MLPRIPSLLYYLLIVLHFFAAGSGSLLWDKHYQNDGFIVFLFHNPICYICVITHDKYSVKSNLQLFDENF